MSESLLLQIVVTINGKRAKALVENNCTTMLVTTGVTNSWSGASNIRVVDGREVKCCEESDAKIVVRNIPLQLRVIVLDKLVAGIDVILGLDPIDQLGRDTIAMGLVKFGNQYVTKMVRGANSNDTIQWYHPMIPYLKSQAIPDWRWGPFELILMVTSAQ